MSFSALAEQPEARLLLAAAVKEGPAHAYLFHGPAGVGKRAAARAFAAELLGDERRVEAGMHPDLFSLEALGEMIRIDEIRALHRDLHMRPFEAERRVYVIADAHLLNDDAADALLKDLEEPPPYAVIVLVADELGPIPPTIRSRCQLVPFRRLSGRVDPRAARGAGAGALGERGARARARLRRPARPGRAAARPGGEGPARGAPARGARALRASPSSTRPTRRRCCSTAPGAAGEAAKERAERELEGVELTSRELEQRLRRVAARRRAGGAARRRSRSWPPGTATSSSSPPAPRRPSCTPTGSSCSARRGRASAHRRPNAAAELAREALADARGVQPEPEPRAGSAVRAAEARVRQRFTGLKENTRVP